MRGFLASSIGVTCAVALALPLMPSAAAVTTVAASPAGTVPAGTVPGAETDVPAPAGERAGGYVPGSTQSLPLRPLARDRATGAAEDGLPRRVVRHFSLVGVVWDDPETELRGRAQVRTRAAGTGVWSGWQDLETHNADHAADPGTGERASGRVRGGTAPLWVGESDGVEVRVRSEAGAGGVRSGGARPTGLRLELVDPGSGEPADSGRAGAGPGGETGPGEGTGTRAPVGGPRAGAAGTGEVLGAAERAASAANAGTAPLGALAVPALTREETEQELREIQRARQTASYDARRTAGAGEGPAAGLEEERTAASEEGQATVPGEGRAAGLEEGSATVPGAGEAAVPGEGQAAVPGETQRVKPYIGPRPRIVTRRGWGANEKLRERTFVYTKKVRAAFVHHTASGNNYRCSQAPSIIRGIYRYHVRSMGWRDIGYNFLVDKCGNIYEGRAGGVRKPVLGAHTLGFNTNSMGIAVVGSYGAKKPSASAVRGVAKLTAWKLGLFGMNPRGKTYLRSGGGNLYRKGRKVRLHVISGHRDGFATACPGRKLYGKLGSARKAAARYQGR